MKKTSLFLLLPIFLIFGCRDAEIENPDVQNYILQLKSGNYQSMELPSFSASDIPALLEYRNDTTSIRKVPANPISSFWMVKCRLGMIALWTIESVRAVEIKSERLIGRYPSQNPILAVRANPGIWVLDEESQREAAKAYYNWWYSGRMFTSKMETDPLERTKYVWH